MPEAPLAPSWDGSVVLDIGGDVGALLLHTSSSMLGHEIDLIPEDASQPHTHSAVRERFLSTGVEFAAVYPHLRAGRYLVEGTDQRVVIEGGRVTLATLTETEPSDSHDATHSTLHPGVAAMRERSDNPESLAATIVRSWRATRRNLGTTSA